jgi:CubicO group peptidase (beta-lactamase class C family)
MSLRQLLVILACWQGIALAKDEAPGERWEKVKPEQVGLQEKKLKQYAERVKGDGCIVRYGKMAYQWGDVKSSRDWASAAKPVLGTMLLFGVEHRVIDSVHTPVAKYGWPLREDDAGITFRQLACMTSGYACEEGPGAAWAYNDYGIELFAQSLERAFGRSLNDAAKDYLAPLQFEDGRTFGSRRGRGCTLSPRDMARLGWFWLNEFKWGERRLISHRLFTRNIRMGVVPELPRSVTTHPDDYLKVGTYGGGVNQTPWGPGCYGFGFWFNGQVATGERIWPSATSDAFQANGIWNRDTVTMYPSLELVVVVSSARKPGAFQPGVVEGRANQNMKLLMDAVITDRPKQW